MYHQQLTCFPFLHLFPPPFLHLYHHIFINSSQQPRMKKNQKLIKFIDDIHLNFLLQHDSDLEHE